MLLKKFHDPELQEFYELAVQRYFDANDHWPHWRDLTDFVYMLRPEYSTRIVCDQMERLYLLGAFDRQSYDFGFLEDRGDFCSEKFRVKHEIS